VYVAVIARVRPVAVKGASSLKYPWRTPRV